MEEAKTNLYLVSEQLHQVFHIYRISNAGINDLNCMIESTQSRNTMATPLKGSTTPQR